MFSFNIRSESISDASAIDALVERAFATAEHKSGTEHWIVRALRASNALTLSLVATRDDVLVGHVAFSPVTVTDGQRSHDGYFGLGPVAVLPEAHRSGVGSALIRAGLEALRTLPARGCVVLGRPQYYGRFGFRAHPAVRYPFGPAAAFQALHFGDAEATGTVAYHSAFDVNSAADVDTMAQATRQK